MKWQKLIIFLANIFKVAKSSKKTERFKILDGDEVNFIKLNKITY